MPFPPRLQIAGATYHVASRATGPSEYFRVPDDRSRLLGILGYAVEKYGWRVHAYCLMVTHYHLLVTTPEPNIARGMQLLNSIYARAFNKRYGRIGHFVGARYSGRLIESEGHALEAARYLPLNPVRSRRCQRPEQWSGSSYAATIGLRRPPAFLNDAWILELFDDDLSTARRLYRDFVDAARVSETLEAPGADGADVAARQRAEMR
jgi:putative transposase